MILEFEEPRALWFSLAGSEVVPLGCAPYPDPLPNSSVENRPDEASAVRPSLSIRR